MLHVLYRINDAESGDATCRYPRENKTPATFSESWSFIWQPNVSRKKVPLAGAEATDIPSSDAFWFATERTLNESKLMSNAGSISNFAV
jgi:hypothetical protein